MRTIEGRRWGKRYACGCTLPDTSAACAGDTCPEHAGAIVECGYIVRDEAALQAEDRELDQLIEDLKRAAYSAVLLDGPDVQAAVDALGEYVAEIRAPAPTNPAEKGPAPLPAEHLLRVREIRDQIHTPEYRAAMDAALALLEPAPQPFGALPELVDGNMTERECVPQDGTLRYWVDGEWRTEGETRWVVRWHVNDTGMADEEDFDLIDLTEKVAQYKSRAAAQRKARAVAGDSYHGCAEVVQQRVQQWEDSPDPELGEWEDVRSEWIPA
jgi:hypothetical protein